MFFGVIGRDRGGDGSAVVFGLRNRHCCSSLVGSESRGISTLGSYAGNRPDGRGSDNVETTPIYKISQPELPVGIPSGRPKGIGFKDQGVGLSCGNCSHAGTHGFCGIDAVSRVPKAQLPRNILPHRPQGTTAFNEKTVLGTGCNGNYSERID